MSNDNSALWASLFKQYRNADDVTSLLLVKCTEGSNAEVCFYVKTGEKNAWVPKGQGNAFIGKNGLGKEREGDARTPEGEFSATMAFGILPDPGTRYDYIDILPETYACDEDCEYYNRIIDSEAEGHKCGGERMYDLSPEYNYGMVLDFNPENIYPLGSAIFLHCKGGKTFTGGCVAVDECLMKDILISAGRGLKVCIHRK